MWVIDTSVDMGFNLLEKISLGHWIAVKSDEDLPAYDSANRTYMTFGKLLSRSIVVATLGLILIRIDVFALVGLIIKLLGGAAGVISEYLQGAG